MSNPLKDATFYDNYVPSLKAAEYEIKVTQSLTVDQAKTKPFRDPTDLDIPPQPTAPVTQKFLVKAPRFAIDPADIHRMFPPKNGTGRYHEYLPMIVLNKRALPWERELNLAVPNKEDYPWLALLVFGEEELPPPVVGTAKPAPGSQGNPTHSTRVPLNQVLKKQSPGPPGNVRGPDLTLEDDEDPTSVVTVIDVPAQTFANLVPSLEDVRLLSHVREVQIHDKEPQNAKHPGWYSVAIANRFAVAPAGDAKPVKNIVHLVSLEGLEDLLGNDQAPAKPGTDFVRMISLASWTYSCLPDLSENFRQLMLDLISADSIAGTELWVRRPLAFPGGAPPSAGTIAVTSKELDGSQTKLQLKEEVELGAPLPSGSSLEVVAPDGSTRETVVTSAAVAKGSTSIPITSQTFQKMPPESWVAPVSAFSPAQAARAIREYHGLARTASALSGSISSIPLAGPSGATQEIPAGTHLEIVDPAGLQRQFAVTSADCKSGATALPVGSINIKTAMPAGSSVGPVDTFRALDRLCDGYVPLQSSTRSGETTYAWYRGPLSAVPVPDLWIGSSPQPAPRTSSEAMIYDERTGLFDSTYAVAFQTGRSLALGSKPFATNLMQWRREAHGLVDLLLEYMHSPQTQATLQKDGILDAQGNLTSTGVSDLAKLLDSSMISNSFQDYLATEFADDLAKRIGKKGGFTPQDSEASPSYPSTPAPQPADLDALTQHPDVQLLLQHLSGLSEIGTTAADLQGTQKSIGLASAGAAIDVGAATPLAIVSPDGSNRVLVTVGAACSTGATTLTIEGTDFKTAMPQGSRVVLANASPLADQILSWLARLALLYDVPFENLLPDESMLPEGSIRFFYLDRDWIACLLDGALSVGAQSSRDSLFHELTRDPLHRSLDAVLHRVRDRLFGVAATGTPPALGRMGGFVLRSQVVSGWPGLEISALSSKDPDTPMRPLRLDRVAPSVMVAIFPEVPVRIDFNEPREGIVFGIEDKGVGVRFLPGMDGATPQNIGQLTDQEEPTYLKPEEIPKRPAPKDNPAVTVGGDGGLASLLVKKFQSQRPSLSPASFAIEMVKVPEQMRFEPSLGRD